MKNIGVLLLGMSVALPVAAQDMTVDEPAAVEETMPADDTAAEETAVDESAEAPAEGVSEDMTAAEAPAEEAVAEEAPVEEAVAEEVPTEESATAEAGTETTDYAAESTFSDEANEAAAEESAGETREPFGMYVGVDRAWATLSFSNDSLQSRFGGDEFDSEFYRVRVGAHVFDAIALEAHIGISDEDGSESGKFEAAEYYGVYIVPTGVLFDLIEVAAPVGYSMMTVERGSASEDLDGISFGLNFEIPLLTDAEWFPDIRIGGGGTVYQAERKSRVYGYHAGLRIDFGV